MKSFKEGRSRWHQWFSDIMEAFYFSVSVASCSIYTFVVLQAKNCRSGSDGKNGVAPTSSFSSKSIRRERNREGGGLEGSDRWCGGLLLAAGGGVPATEDGGKG
ncbi:hypothetical protein L2E82_50041 [Cichorium intybus]|nr:hypothetical protein L2E82_50041 [Cichorium intybus]